MRWPKQMQPQITTQSNDFVTSERCQNNQVLEGDRWWNRKTFHHFQIATQCSAFPFGFSFLFHWKFYFVTFFFYSTSQIRFCLNNQIKFATSAKTSDTKEKFLFIGAKIGTFKRTSTRFLFCFILFNLFSAQNSARNSFATIAKREIEAANLSETLEHFGFNGQIGLVVLSKGCAKIKRIARAKIKLSIYFVQNFNRRTEKRTKITKMTHTQKKV